MTNEPIVIPEDPEDAKLENYRIVYNGLQNPPQTAATLYQFLTALTGEYIPWQSCCPGHTTPWELIWRSYRVDLDQYRKTSKRGLIYIGPRGGYKTLSVAKLITSELLLKPNCHIIGLAAIESQADRAYKYVSRYLMNPVIVEMGLVQKLLMKETRLNNGSSYGQVCATLAGVNSPHPHKLCTEENDLMKPEILQEALMMPTSFAGLQAHTIFVSTRKFADGVMDNLIENAEAQQNEVLISCYKDTAEPCPVERRGNNQKSYEVQDLCNPGQTVIVEAYEYCGTCPLLASCKGDLSRAKGIVKIDDLISEWHKLDRETWIFQKECGKSKQIGLFFEDFNENMQTGEFPYTPRWGPVDMAFDFSGGGEDPTVCTLWQTDESGNDYCIAELIFNRKLASDVAQQIKNYCSRHGITSIRHQFGDSAAMQWISELNAIDPAFFRIKPTRKIQRRDGWAVLKQRICDLNNQRKMFFNNSCRLIITELKTAKKSKSDPLDIKDGQSDHALDAARYRAVELYFRGIKEPKIRIIGDTEDRKPVLPFSSEGSKIEEDKTNTDGFGNMPRYLFGDND